MSAADTLITYGADWTEYGAHVVDGAAHEVRFPLDALWASSAIDAVGIDYYVPLSDWRGDANELDRALANSIYDPAYLAGNLRRGEAYDWYYADDAARSAQTRSAITDGLGKPWVFRAKDFWNWWANPHYERVGGAELVSHTAWAPQSKPIWLTEIGCPAVDKGANQPSTFPDPKSADGGLPYFSNGRRDDLIQRRFLEAVLGAFDPAYGADAESNPVSSVYGGRMIAPDAIHLWTWDARPYPIFPAAIDVWSDGPNWETGHWLTGRLGGAPLDALVATILDDAEIGDFDSSALRESVDGYVIDRPMSPRAAIEPLALAYAFDAGEVDGKLVFRQRGGEVRAEIAEDDLLLPEDRAPARLVRAQETELAREVSLSFTDSGSDYRRSAVTSRRLVGGAARTSHADLAVVTSDAAAERRADIWLQDLWAGRESAEFALPPSYLALAAGDVVGLTIGGRRHVIELRDITDTEGRALRAQSIDPAVFDVPLALPRRRPPDPPTPVGPVHAVVLDLPTLTADDPPILQRLAVFADPWPGAVAIWRSADGLSFERAALAFAPSIIGETLDDLAARADQPLRPRAARAGEALRRRVGVGLRHACCSPAPMRPPCSVRMAPGRSSSSPMPTWSTSAPTSSRGCCAARPAASGRWAIRCRRARRSCCSTSTSRRSRAASTRSGRPCSFASSRPTAIMATRRPSRSARRRRRPRCDRLRRCICGRDVASMASPSRGSAARVATATRWDAIDVPLGEDQRGLRARRARRRDREAHAVVRRAVGALRRGRRNRRFRRRAIEPRRARRAALGHRRPRRRGAIASSLPEAP